MSEEKAWSYNRGAWEEVPYPFLFAEGEDWDKAIRALGYALKIPERENDPCLSIWERTGQSVQPWAYLLWFSLAGLDDGADLILIPDLPSLLMFLRDYEGIIQRQRLNDVLNMLPQVFQAWHGHAWYEDCRECDPVAVEQRMRRAAERRAAKQAKTEAA
jgi:hypothetical protein